MGCVAHSYHVENPMNDCVTHENSLARVHRPKLLLLECVYSRTHCTDGLQSRPYDAKPVMYLQDIMNKQGGCGGLLIRQDMGIDRRLMLWGRLLQ